VTLAGFGVTSLFPTPLIRHAMAQGVDNPDKRMIFIFQRGGNDGINTVIPTGDPDYNTTNRPTLYIPPGSAVDLGNGFAHLHPGLSDLMDLYPNDLAIIHRCGYQNNTRSHFDGQRIWENGDPTQPQLFEGWLYRYIQENAVDVGVDLPVISVQATPPLILRGDTKYVNVANPDNFDYIDPDPKRSKYSDAWKSLYQDLTGLEAYRPVLSQTGVKLIDTLDEYRSWDQLNYRPRDPNNSTDELFPVDDQIASQGVPHSKGFSAESYEFFRSLKICALSLLESVGSANGTRIAGAQINGWDLHDNQGQVGGGRHEELLSWLAYGIRSLRLVLNGTALDNRSYPDIWNDTLVSTLTEFGRTTVENGSTGTDHAASTVVFVAGGSVTGGVYNCNNTTDWPAGVMFAVNGRYLQEATDYRAVFWEILRDHMGANPADVDTIFPGYTSLGLGAQELGIV
jgi:uncharacterized protein (DUF1501 family)